MKIGSLFSGIGGLELGLEWAGVGETTWQVEQDPYCRAVLAKHWPRVDRSVTDVRCAGVATLPPVGLICGGFPCQDVSSAGDGAGLDGARSGLWWEFHRCIDELRPRVAVVENVASGARRWLCAVRGSLHELGYRTRALGIAGVDVGAPHLRRRIFVVAYADRGRQLQQSGAERSERRRACDGSIEQLFERDGGAERPTEPCLGGGPHGLPRRLDGHRWPAPQGAAQHEWEPPRQAHGIPNRAARLKALGNAVMPQMAYIVGLAIRQDLGA